MALCATRHQRTKPSRTPSSRNFSVLAPTARVDSNPKCTHRLDSPLMTSASMGLLVAVVPAVGSVRMTLRASRHQRSKPSRAASSRNFSRCSRRRLELTPTLSAHTGSTARS